MTAASRVTARTAPAWAVLDRVMDPEVPVLSVVELGIIRDVELDDAGAITVSVTPTYSGCPAMRVIEGDILSALAAAGWPAARVRTVYSPAWTTDWLDADAREKLRRYGIAPPSAREASGEALVPLRRSVPSVACPYCGSRATTTRSEFGSTACKALMYCDQCRQPFEQFKAF
jgi:ring-1,2-phenylacetyl-CoA epoxidase subunit PaaD